MKLTITTPLGVIVDNETIRSLRAEDATGSFGILQGHADFISVLSISVLKWQIESDELVYCAVCKGLLTVTNGNKIFVATREAILGTDLTTLKNKTLDNYFLIEENEAKMRATQELLQAEAIKNIQKYLLKEDQAEQPY